MILLKNAKIISMDESFEREFTGDILMDGTVIKAVGRDLPAEGAEIFDLTGMTVVPGFVDAHCHIGLFEDGMGFEGDDGNEMSATSTPDMRAIDAINPFDRCFVEARSGGVTTCVTGPGSANVVGGTFCAIKTFGRDVEDMLLKETVAMKAAFGENPKRVYHSQKTIFTRMQIAATLRRTLIKAKEYDRKIALAGDDASKLPEKDLAMESLLPVVRRELPLKIHAHRADDILTAIRIAKEFNIRITLDHCTEGYMIPELIKETVDGLGAGVIVGPLLSDRGKIELRNLSFEAPRILYENGIPFAIMTDSPVIPEQYLPIEAGLAAREGLPEYEALKAITINAARITGLDDRIGSITAGKDADIAVFDGDPLQTLSHCVMTFINGKLCYKRG